MHPVFLISLTPEFDAKSHPEPRCRLLNMPIDHYPNFYNVHSTLYLLSIARKIATVDLTFVYNNRSLAKIDDIRLLMPQAERPPDVRSPGFGNQPMDCCMRISPYPKALNTNFFSILPVSWVMAYFATHSVATVITILSDRWTLYILHSQVEQRGRE